MKAILVGLILVVGCARTQAESEENYIQTVDGAPVVKKGDKNAPTKADPRRDAIKYVLRLSDPASPFTAEDEAYFQSLPKNPAAGSFQEAAAAIGAIRSSLHAATSETRFDEQDLKQPAPDASATPAPTTTASTNLPSLERLITEKGVQLADALERNVIIRTHRVYALTLDALKKTQNSPQFQEKVTGVIEAEAKQWAALIPQPTGQTTPVPGEAVSEDAALPTLPETRYSPADLRQGDTTLVDAERLADDGEFKQAISKVASIHENDPFYRPAQEKIKVYSNRAVQTLRQKAAAAFQNAQPVSDAREKAAFLAEARRYLEEALSQYPQAEQIDTVRENLAVISRDLERLTPKK